MANAQKQPSTIELDTYLDGEKLSSTRHEFVRGRVYAMAGASERHSVIKLNLASAFNGTVAEDCRVFDGDIKLRIERGDDVRFYYPDVFVSCEASDDDYWRLDAVLIVEVLSRTTERSDRYEKFAAYTALTTLSEYVLVEQDTPSVEVFRRRTGWQVETFGPGTSVTFESIGETMSLDAIYRRIKF
jgi:Uma2 family endonuclease